MYCIITGDIVNSRMLTGRWLSRLKAALTHLARSSGKWEIFRGDSFQLEVRPELALHAAIYLKASMKINKQADVRMGIGLGMKNGRTRKLSESSGSVFINSGEAFDSLKLEKASMRFKSEYLAFDREVNILLRLALIAMDDWGPATAKIVKLSMENPDLLQIDLAKISGKTQSTISAAVKRAHYNEIMEMNALYIDKVNLLK